MPTDPTRELAEQNVKSILEWLAQAHGRTSPDDAGGLQAQLLTLRSTPIPDSQRLKLLDLLYSHAAQMTLAQLPTLHDCSLPVPRRVRQPARTTQDLLDVLAQDYLNSLAELFDPEAQARPRSPHHTLRRVMHCLAWHLTIGFLVAAPATPGIWQQMHGAFRASRRLLQENPDSSGEARRSEQIYTSTLLVAIAQPASFTSRELEFISTYIDNCAKAVGIEMEAPIKPEGVFWVDPEKDTAANALVRRIPPPDTEVYYFACDVLAQGAADHLSALERGISAADLGLPPLADTPGGHGVLRRLTTLWGHPVKRKFPRRRQSYRADLCAGLDRLWHLLQHPEDPPNSSEWMVVNESPDGYSMMHVSGATENIQTGDIVAVRPHEERDNDDGPWHICIVRWALSENPEHVELGLQVLAPRAVAAHLATPQDSEHQGKREALLLPKLPPLRPFPALIVPTGAVNDRSHKLIVLVDSGKLEIREYRARQVAEQTSSIEMFMVEPDERP